MACAHVFVSDWKWQCLFICDSTSSALALFLSVRSYVWQAKSSEPKTLTPNIQKAYSAEVYLEGLLQGFDGDDFGDEGGGSSSGEENVSSTLFLRVHC